MDMNDDEMLVSNVRPNAHPINTSPAIQAAADASHVEAVRKRRWNASF
jgi:hypothetical protein